MEQDIGRKPLAPYPNHQTKATFAEVISWAGAVDRAEWSWTRNGQCKYVTIRLDTRAGAYSLQDRDGNEISLNDLMWQYGGQTPTPSPSTEQS